MIQTKVNFIMKDRKFSNFKNEEQISPLEISLQIV